MQYSINAIQAGSLVRLQQAKRGGSSFAAEKGLFTKQASKEGWENKPKIHLFQGKRLWDIYGIKKQGSLGYEKEHQSQEEEVKK